MRKPDVSIAGTIGATWLLSTHSAITNVGSIQWSVVQTLAAPHSGTH
jgi:hypothetical protein